MGLTAESPGGQPKQPAEPAAGADRATSADSPTGAAGTKPKRKKSVPLTQHSLKKMRDLGYTCAVVEHWNSFVGIRQDLFGFIDILCVRDTKVVGVQCTSWDEVKRRIDKITGHENYDLIKHAIPIVVQGWKKVAGRWICKEVEL